MDSSIQIFSNGDFSIRTTTDNNGTFWFVAKDILTALEYSADSNPSRVMQSVPDIWKGVKRIHTPGGEQEMLCLTEQGVYFFLGRSDKPKALPYQMWIAGDVVPQIRRTGSYSVSSSSTSKDELELRRKDLDLRGAQILQNMIDKEMFPITPETRTVFAHEVFKLVTGHPYLAMLPESTEKWYTATDIGLEFGLSANMVGRIAKSNGIKAPEGESNEFGRWIFSKSKYSSREVPSFIYSEYGRDWFRQYQLQALS